MLAVDRVKPCPWCGAQAGKPCRAERGKGSELNWSVHTVRRKPTADSPKVETLA